MNTIPSINILSRERSFTCVRYGKLQNWLRKRRKELIIFCHHPPTLTAGIQSKKENLLTDIEKLRDMNIEHISVKRGGDYTAHEPGQCVIYVHLDLKKRKFAVQYFFHLLLEITARNLNNTWNLETEIRKNDPGLYLKENGKKIASAGIRCQTQFSSFGIALNVQNNLSIFKHIRPCGLDAKMMTGIIQNKKDPEKLLEFINGWVVGFDLKLKDR